MAARPRTTRQQSFSDRAVAGVGSAAGEWAKFTLATDTDPTFFKVPHVAVNWAFIAAVVAGMVFATDRWQWWALAAVVGVIYTIGRAARHVPSRRKALDRIYRAMRPTCALPNSTVSRPVDPRAHIAVRRWRGAGKPAQAAITYGEGARADNPGTRALAEKAWEATAPARKGHAWVFDHSPPNAFIARQVTEDAPEVAQRRTRIWIDQTMARLFPKAGADLSVETVWADGDRPDVPETITVEYGPAHNADAAFRETVEADIDSTISRGVEWLYAWDPGTVTITAAPTDSPEAEQKRTAREITRMFRTQLGTAEKAATVTVEQWLPDNSPLSLTITLDGGYTNPLRRRATEFNAIAALYARWPNRAWLPKWQHLGQTVLTLQAVPTDSVEGIRQIEQQRFYTAMDTAMKVTRNATPPDLTITQWRDIVDQSTGKIVGSKPAEITIDLGAWSANEPKQEEAEGEFDRLSTETGFAYHWDLDHDQLQMTEFPALPRYAFFPDIGSEEFLRQEALARQGIITLGPAKGGTHAVLDFNTVPHCLFGGNTGTGKSVALTIVLFWALWLPDVYELLVADPKLTDFPFTEEFPNVQFASKPSEITNLVGYAKKAMQQKQQLLSQHGVEKIEYLHEMAARGEIPAEDAPRRTLLFFDEMAAFLNPSKNEEVMVLQEAARADLEQIMMLGRAPWVNTVGAAQKPSDKNLGTQIRELMGGKVGVGYMKANMSEQVLGDTRAAQLSRKNTPRGRAWVLMEGREDRLTQTYYLPKRDETVTWADGQPHREGVVDIIRRRLAATGWQQITVTNEAGGKQFRWVRPDWVEEGGGNQPSPLPASTGPHGPI